MKFISGLTNPFAILTATACILISNVYAQPSFQECRLNDVCPTPGNDSHSTNFSIHPSNGTLFQCTIQANQNNIPLIIWVGSKGAFSTLSGGGLFKVNPEVMLDISGRFDNPKDEKSTGYLTFKHLMGPEGKIVCHAKK